MYDTDTRITWVSISMYSGTVRNKVICTVIFRIEQKHCILTIHHPKIKKLITFKFQQFQVQFSSVADQRENQE